MGIVERFGGKVGSIAETNGARARRLLLLGYAAQQFRLKHFPDRKLTRSKQYLAWAVMQYMRSALAHPARTAMTSLFIPCEPLIAIGYKAFSIEGFSAFMTGTRCEIPLLDAEDTDQNLCTYHRIFLGAAKLGLLPVSPFGLFTNVACDANLISFPELSAQYHMPTFFVDVPYDDGDESVHYVANQLRNMVAFIEDCTHRRITDDQLGEVQYRMLKSSQDANLALTLAAKRYVPSDITSSMYEVLLSRMMYGEKAGERYWRLLAEDYQRADDDTGIRLLWIHTVPFSQDPVRKLLNNRPDVHVVAVDLAYDPFFEKPDPTKPYDTMARRLVRSGFSGSVERRIRLEQRLVRILHPRGAILFNHWGCKMTLGASALIKEALEREGIPVLLLDGDGADMRNQSDGQTETRLGAFLEMLQA